MAYRNSIGTLLTIAVLAGAVAPVRADTPADAHSSHAALASSASSACEGLAQDEARQRAQDAQRAGAHRRAAECFRVAGDHVRADRALVRASADTSEVSGRKAAETIESAKLQARRLREAFR